MLDFIVNVVFGFFFTCILGRTLLSYIVPMSGSRPHPTLISVQRFVFQVTEPILGPIRRYLTFGCGWGGEVMTVRGVRVLSVAPSGPHRHERSESTPPEPVQPPLEEPDDLIETLIDQAVARRLEADVPLGCFLSGGVDSSLIAHYARQHNPDLATFCVRMPDPRYDESRYAQQVADLLGTNHTTLSVAPDPADDLIRLIGLLGQPFGDSSP